MTDNRMALVELLRKGGESDFLRAVAEAELQILMEPNVESLIGAGRHERSPIGSITAMATAIAVSSKTMNAYCSTATCRSRGWLSSHRR